VPEGRISPADAGIWNDSQAQAYQAITRFVRDQGAVAGIQLAHAGRKASTSVPWEGHGYVEPADGGWSTVGPSAVGFADWPAPHALGADEVADVVDDFARAASRATAAGFEVVEVHAAHGYLLHEFLSPLSNRRTDQYGGSFDNRVRLLLEVAQAVRSAWPEHQPVFVRLSATDWVDGGWALPDTVEVSRRLAAVGIDLIDVSSGGLHPDQQIPAAPGFQVPFSRAVREQAGVATCAVGLITEPRQAEHVIAEGSADAVMLGRAMLRNPHWPLQAAAELRGDAAWPAQYQRAALR
jgi:2,4-dienoyl-CoA reductase-like NADH-dependent reductase (Old Yellow Enzyme family)